MLEMVVKAVNNFSYHDLSYICVSLSQYLEFLGKLFRSILYTYNSVFCTPVPQSLVCDTSAMGVNLFLTPNWPLQMYHTQRLETQECQRLYYMYKVRNKRVYPQIPSID